MRACGAPSKSSIELAWLREVEGLGGGPAELPGRDELSPVVETALVEIDRAGPNAGVGGRPRDVAGLLDSGGGGAPPDDDGRLPVPAGIGGTGGGGILAPLAVRLGGPIAFGGGGVARVGVALFGSFLLTHFFRSLSK